MKSKQKEDIEKALEAYHGPGVPYKNGWPMEKIRMLTKIKHGYWFDDIYSYENIKNIAERKTEHENIIHGKPLEDSQELDEFLWNEFTSKLEESRQIFHDALIDFGVCEQEAHFLSVKFILSTISKFRLKMWMEFGKEDGRKDYVRTALRNAVNILYRKFEAIKVYDQYLFSKEAVQSEVVEFRKQAALETARLLAEEVGAVLHSKLTL